MSTRTLLSSEQRIRLFSIPTDLPEMVRHFTIGMDDLALIRTKRRSVNRLGCAVQLCLLRYPGFGLGPTTQPPAAMIAIEREIGMNQLEDVLPIIGAVADVADQDILVTAAERYAVLRRFSPRFLAAFDFRSNVPNDPVLAALELLRALNRGTIRTFPKRPPSAFLPPQWRKLIFASGTVDRRLYETAVLAVLRDKLRGSNIWVAGSRDYQAFETYLLPAGTGTATGIDGETDPNRYIETR